MGNNRERRGKGKSRNINRGLTSRDNGVGIDCGNGLGHRAGESNEEKGRTTVTQQQ